MASSAQSFFEKAHELEWIENEKENPNFEWAIENYEKAIELGHVDALHDLASLLLTLDTAEPEEEAADYAKALELLYKAAFEHQHREAMRRLADLYYVDYKLDREQIKNTCTLAISLLNMEGTNEEKNQDFDAAFPLLLQAMEHCHNGDEVIPEQVEAMHRLAHLYLTKNNITIEDIKAMNRLAKWLMTVQGTEEEKAQNEEKADRLLYGVLSGLEYLIELGNIQGIKMYVDMFLEDFDADKNYNSEALSKIVFKVYSWKNAEISKCFAEALLHLSWKKSTENERDIYDHAINLYRLAAHQGCAYSKRMCLWLFLKDFDRNDEKMYDMEELSILCEIVLNWREESLINSLFRRLSRHRAQIPLESQPTFDYCVKSLAEALIRIRINECFWSADRRQKNPKEEWSCQIILVQDVLDFGNTDLMFCLAGQFLKHTRDNTRHVALRQSWNSLAIKLYQEASRLGHGGAEAVLKDISPQRSIKRNSVASAMQGQGVFSPSHQQSNQGNQGENSNLENTPPEDPNRSSNSACSRKVG